MVTRKNFLICFSLLLFGIVFTSCKSKNSSQVDNTSEVLVQLYDDTSVGMLEGVYVSYEFQKKKVVSRPMHIFLFTFNSKKINQSELIKLLKTSDLVKEAQPNKNVQQRN